MRPKFIWFLAVVALIAAVGLMAPIFGILVAITIGIGYVLHKTRMVRISRSFGPTIMGVVIGAWSGIIFAMLTCFWGGDGACGFAGPFFMGIGMILGGTVGAGVGIFTGEKRQEDNTVKEKSFGFALKRKYIFALVVGAWVAFFAYQIDSVNNNAYGMLPWPIGVSIAFGAPLFGAWFVGRNKK